jgi:hypothetical protein
MEDDKIREENREESCGEAWKEKQKMTFISLLLFYH